VISVLETLLSDSEEIFVQFGGIQTSESVLK